MYLYLVRHGQSEGNARKLFFGQWDCPLTAQGRQDAWQAAEKLRAVEFARCYASDLQRAWETAEVCTTGRLLAPEKCPGLREQDMGALEQKTWEEAAKICGGEKKLQQYLADWYHEDLPTVEPAAQMEARVSEAVDEIIRRGEDALIVAHNGSLTLLLYHLGLIRLEELLDMSFQFRFGCYSVIRIGEDGTCLEGFNL